MGSRDFAQITRTNHRAHTAYRDACSKDAHTRDTGISTTQGVNVVPTGGPVTMAEAYRIMHTRSENLSKWGACEAIELINETRATYGPERRHVGVVVDLTYDQVAEQATLFAALAAALNVNVSDVRTARATAMTNVVTKVQATAPREATETRYFIIDNPDVMPPWETGHPSQSAARQALTDHKVGSWATTEVEIISMTRRVSGAPLVSATVSPRSATVTYTVWTQAMLTPATVGTGRSGWLFYGWAPE